MSQFRGLTVEKLDISVNLDQALQILWKHENHQYPGTITGAVVLFTHDQFVRYDKESAQRLARQLEQPQRSSLPPAGWGFR